MKINKTPRGKWKLLLGQLLSSYRRYYGEHKAMLALSPGMPIFITGAYRTGTTWFANMLAIPGIWYFHEPFNPNKGIWQEEFTYFNGNAGNKGADKIMEGILSQRLKSGPIAPILHQPRSDHWLMPARILSPKVNRILIKDPIACLMSEYLTQKFHLQTLVLFRHPAGFVGSLKLLQWPVSPRIRQFLYNRDLMEHFLHPYESLMSAVLKKDTIETIAVLYGCINTVLWSFITRNIDMKALIFEEYCSSPLEKFQLLFQSLQLPYNDIIREMHIQLCLKQKSGRDNYRPHDINRNSYDMAFRWKRLLTADEVNKVRSVWEQFELPLYRSAEEWEINL
jgi:hypothetical protein